LATIVKRTIDRAAGTNPMETLPSLVLLANSC